MDPLAPVAGISLEQYAELCSLVAEHPADLERSMTLLQPAGISQETWIAARQGWQARLEDPSLGGAVATRFVPTYQAALARHRGQAPWLSFEEYVALSAEVMHFGLAVTLVRYDLELYRYTQITFHWNAAMSREPQKFVAYVCMVEQELLRLHHGGERNPIASLAARLASQATAAAEPAPEAETNEYKPAEAPAAVAMPAPVPVPAPAPIAPPAPVPAPVSTPKRFEEEAGDAAKAVGGAIMSGFNKLGNALDNFGKSLSKPAVGSRVLVQWSDGNKYPGTVTQVATGQMLINMGDNNPIWVPEQYVSLP